MGMFDTIVVKPALRCPRCEVEVTSLQTKEFGNVLETYSVGSVMTGCSVRTGIIEERMWCKACSDAGGESEWRVYLVIWHSVLAAVECDFEIAERKLRQSLVVGSSIFGSSAEISPNGTSIRRVRKHRTMKLPRLGGGCFHCPRKS